MHLTPEQLEKEVIFPVSKEDDFGREIPNFGPYLISSVYVLGGFSV